MWPNEVMKKAFKGKKIEKHVCVPVKFDRGTVLTVGGKDAENGWLVMRNNVLLMIYPAVMGSDIFYPQHQVGPKDDLNTSIVWNNSYEIAGKPVRDDDLLEVGSRGYFVLRKVK